MESDIRKKMKRPENKIENYDGEMEKSPKRSHSRRRINVYCPRNISKDYIFMAIIRQGPMFVPCQEYKVYAKENPPNKI